jgi:methyl-accepting chemotaxis protein
MADDKGLSGRVKFIELGDETSVALRRMKPRLMAAMGPALDRFYDKIRQEPAVAHFFAKEGLAAHAKARQLAHWDRIADGEFDAQYLAAVTRVGEIHARIGLEPRWYIAGYAIILKRVIEPLLAEHWPKGRFVSKKSGHKEAAGDICALIKAALLDMDLAIDVYMGVLQSARVAAEEKARQASEAVISELSQAISALAGGDLTYRIGAGMPAEYGKLREDFNATLAELQSVMTTIGANARDVRMGSEEISTASDDLARRTEQQAASLEQTAAALDEITATVKQTAEGVAKAREVAEAASTDAKHSSDVVRETVAAMGGIEESSSKIGNIIGVIDEIAFQTNLLALNAGVEAARAGDAGRGFAVVATEVRALAQRSADAAKEIKKLISSSGEQVGAGVKLVGDTGRALERIVGQVAQLGGLVATIAASAAEQSTGLREVNTAVNQMDQVTQRNAAMVEETNAASHSLAGKAVELTRMVGRFKTGQDSARAAEPARRAPKGARSMENVEEF